ncbi:MAG TPA: UDP-N-acetylmuramoyl-L-alanine--D-glutamate ligase [Dongiaceae bacterium]|nr:UDP-N-acetylmuramoyl-L-alanine--D-glutamate ligase [Dongiaceae bacterium]
MGGTLELKGKRLLVIGLARTGVAVAEFAASRGAVVTATDARPLAELRETVDALEAIGVRSELGAASPELLKGQDLVVPSPGVPANAPLLEAARGAQIPVWSEIELAYRFLRGTLIGITGSNGKTTTSTLVEHILCHAGRETILAGNIGTPLIARVADAGDETVIVAELSSFQLELIDSFRPRVALFLNLTPDHLDRHATFAAYGAAKARIFENQTANDIAILNADDPASAPYTPTEPHVYRFSRTGEVAPGVFVRGDQILFRDPQGKEEVLLAVSDIALPGPHNLENVLAAALATRLTGVPAAQIAEAVRSFKGVEHRIEFVAEIAGVRYYNDSKATNVDATLKALGSFPGRVLVILGGKDKDSDYRLLRDALREKAVLALLIGAAAEKIASQIAGSVAIAREGTLDRAVAAAAQSARPGNIVLLAPACASFDQFQNYEHRGRVFKQLVRELQGRSAIAAASGESAVQGEQGHAKAS